MPERSSVTTLEIAVVLADATATIRLTGRLDATSAETLAAAVPAAPELRRLVLDLGACPFVSSGGIRVIMTQYKRLAPLGGGVELVNVGPQVRRVFELSGLNEILVVREKPREISIEGLPFLSEGVFGEVFRLDDETVVKLYRDGLDPAVVEREKRFARAAFVAGIPTAISLDLVTSGGRFGIAYEMLGADSLAGLMRREPDRLDDHARLLAHLARTIHATPADPAVFPDIKANCLGWLAETAPLLAPADVDLLRGKIEAIPDADTCVHFDLHGGNVMIRNGEPIVIDMGDFSRGSPLFDLGLVETIYSPAVGICERVTKLPNDVGADFLTRFLDHYFAGRPDELASFEVDRAFYASLRLLHSIRLLKAIPDFRQQLIGVLRDGLIPAMRAGGVR
jgi:uncharacterized protein (TIGR02172 family)